MQMDKAVQRACPWASGRACARQTQQVMEEVMAKSKAARSARQLQRAEDLDATEALDANFAALVSQGGLEGLVRAP